eukprot:gnl/Spiro4/15473_TR8329_c0_g1_i1.p1 gnl/Spiro4/15473_TR8329_c0_g1~~gnl/Spiro4/15473_TR8329_c0_g1_i1.p1  ORF type:complete len:631 (-),score=182.25 gnl/Spiro4/15473_TR8329_c0_g1_i1:100-1947(-)
MSHPLCPHSFASGDVRVTNYDINVTVDFKRRVINGFTDVTAEVNEDGARFLNLDGKAIGIESVLNLDTNEIVLFTIPASSSIGFHLQIPLASPGVKGRVVRFRIHSSTTPQSGGIQWLSAEQTTGKKHPFMFTQFEAILARTMIPCQDTPAVKTPYTISVTCPSPLVAACSGIAVGDRVLNDDGSITYSYRQTNPIPAYLIAIVCGKIAKAQVGPRSSVWSEPELLEKCVHEFSAETESFVAAGEHITGVSYDWGVYDMVILPGSFPYGGMENPNLTFLNAALLAGDRSLTNVVAHEITHSWAGNYVTNSSWTDFWLNEGFTVYIERLILGHVRHSEAYRHFEALCGYNDLIKTVERYGATHEFTKLQPNLTGIDPDDAFSKIPYEKGSLFLLYLETQIVGSVDLMKQWLHSYFTTFRNRSLSTADMRAHFLKFFEGKVSKLGQIDWDAWLHAPGLPAFDPNTVLDRSLTVGCHALADKWIKHGGEGTSPSDLNGFQAKQIMFFLDLILTTPGVMPFAHNLLEKLDQTYNLSSSTNVETSFRWLMLALSSNYTAVLPAVAAFLAKNGRGLYVRPMFAVLNTVDHAFAVRVYHENHSFYHSVIHSMYDDVLEWNRR